MDEIIIESDPGFCYSIELLVKCHDWLADRRGAGELVRAHARLGPFPGIALAAGLPALVCLCVRRDLSEAAGADGAIEVYAI